MPSFSMNENDIIQPKHESFRHSSKSTPRVRNDQLPAVKKQYQQIAPHSLILAIHVVTKSDMGVARGYSVSTERIIYQ